MVKIESESQSLTDRRNSDKKRNCMLICISYLRDIGLTAVSQTLSDQFNGVTSDFELADNISLPIILSEFESMYELKFSKKPVIAKRKVSGADGLLRPSASLRRISRGSPVPVNDENVDCQASLGSLLVKGTHLDEKHACMSMALPAMGAPILETRFMLPPLIADNPELKDLAGTLINTPLQGFCQVTWDDVVGAQDAKSALYEAVVLPRKYPELFSGAFLQPWRGILLFGPPGTGKTMLAKAVAATCSCHFISLSPSSLLSKWRGESEKLVKCVFAIAEYNKPSIIFIDEIDAVLPKESSGDSGEHESTRRMRAELLTSLDGISALSGGVCVIGSSNCPWNLSPALLRRFERRILVDTPDSASRLAILNKFVPNTEGVSYIADMTDGWSGDDLRVLCKEAAMASLRRVVASAEKMRSHAHPRSVCIPQISIADLNSALRKVKPSCKENPKYRQWYSEFGSS